MPTETPLVNTVFAASAGTGKTRALIGVYLDLLERGEEPGRIVAITFTEKAARELRDRVRGAIAQRIGDCETSRLWLRALLGLSAAPISTIHGFCMMVLREHGHAAGVDPGFTIVDPQSNIELARETAAEIVREGVRTGDAEITRLFQPFGLDRLVGIAIDTIARLNSSGHDGEWLEARAADQVREAEALRQAMAGEIEPFNWDFEKIGDAADQVQGKKLRKHALFDRKNPNSVLPRTGQIAGAELAPLLARLVTRIQSAFIARKRDAGQLDFDDLLIAVRNALRDSVPLRQQLQRFYRAILVDEFQDTDEVQAEIVSYLAGNPERPDQLLPGKLFIAGDAKQSIYRFRRAQVSVFLRLMERIRSSGGAVVPLKDNYRSSPELCRFFNALSGVMLDGAGKAGADALIEGDVSHRIRFSDADALEAKETAPCLGMTYVASAAGIRAEEGRSAEARAIARLVRGLMDDGRIDSWRQVAVLFRSLGHVNRYVSELGSHGVPSYVVEGTNFYQRAEVSDLIALLEWIVQPSNAVARAAVLTSPLAGVRFDDLMTGMDAPDALNRVLQPWRERRDSATAAEILQDVVRRTQYDVVLAALPDGERRVANVGKLIEVTRQLARQGTNALDDVVRFLRSRANDPAVKEPQAQTLGNDDNVVRLMTVHQAKGLEFDVVIVADAGAKPPADRAPHAWSERWGLLCASPYGLHRKTLPHALMLQAQALDDDQQHEEEKRLLYVAVTRARRMLVISEAFHKAGGVWLASLEKFFSGLGDGVLDEARNGNASRLPLRKGSGFVVDIVPSAALCAPEQPGLFASNPGPEVEDVSRLERLRPPARRVLQRGPIEFTVSELTPGSRSAPDPSSARAGIVVHRILETGAVPSREELQALGIEDIGVVLGSGEWRELQAGALERELPFVLIVETDRRTCRIHGRMDVAVLNEGRARVIDYKYARWSPGRESDYDVPMSAYALALMRSLGTGRADTELWYLREPMKIVRRTLTLPEAESRVVAAVRARLQEMTEA